MNKLDVNNARDARVFLGVVLAILLLSVSGWGACTTWTRSFCDDKCNRYVDEPGWLPSYDYLDKIVGDKGSHGCASYYYYCLFNGVKCSSQCEADSTICISQGNSWRDDPSASCGKSCKINHCKAADSTWLSTSIAACTGSNNYALVNTDSTCEHVGACCPNDSIPSGNTCKWRCDSVLTTCGNRTGELFGGVLPDTSISGQDTTFSYQCYYNCSHSPNADSSVYLVEGNIVLGGPSDSIPDGIKSQSTFNSVRTETGGVYVYDYLTPAASEYIDSIAAMKCVEHLWRCVINSKYVYWYDNQEVPAGCTNIVRVK